MLLCSLVFGIIMGSVMCYAAWIVMYLHNAMCRFMEWEKKQEW